jgi:hypothetical protein
MSPVTVAILLIILLGAILIVHSIDMNRRFDNLEKKIAQLERGESGVDAEQEKIRASAQAWDKRVAAEKLAAEKTARNREVKRRAKERKAECQRDRLLTAFAESQKQEQEWRDQKAQDHGWTVHPNDINLEDHEREAMREAWRTGAPQPEYHSDK